MVGLEGFEDGLFVHRKVGSSLYARPYGGYNKANDAVYKKPRQSFIGSQENTSIQKFEVCLIGPCPFRDRSKSNAGSAALLGDGVKSTSRTSSGSLPCFLFFAGGFRVTSTAKIWVPVSPWPLKVVSEKA